MAVVPGQELQIGAGFPNGIIVKNVGDQRLSPFERPARNEVAAADTRLTEAKR